jgi:hypothetical protein
MIAPMQMKKPSNWQDFEKFCKLLWGEIWYGTCHDRRQYRILWYSSGTLVPSEDNGELPKQTQGAIRMTLRSTLWLKRMTAMLKRMR